MSASFVSCRASSTESAQTNAAGSSAYIPPYSLSGSTIDFNGLDCTNIGTLSSTVLQNVETVAVKDHILELNSTKTAVSSAGLVVKREGALSDYHVSFNESTDVFEIGASGSLQPVATRNTSGNLTNGAPAVWNSSALRFDTPAYTLSLTGDTSVNQALTSSSSPTFAGVSVGSITGTNADNSALVIAAGATAGVGANIELYGPTYASPSKAVIDCGTLAVREQDGSPQFITVGSAGLTLQSGSTVNAILDEDTLTTNSATALCTQQSIKAYVDNFVGSVNITTLGTVASGSLVSGFGNITTTGLTTSSFTFDTVLLDGTAAVSGGSISKICTASDIKSYADGLATLSSLTTTGALNSGSITSGFGAINNGSSTLSTGAITCTGLTAGAAATLVLAGYSGGPNIELGSTSTGSCVIDSNTLSLRPLSGATSYLSATATGPLTIQAPSSQTLLLTSNGGAGGNIELLEGNCYIDADTCTWRSDAGTGTRASIATGGLTLASGATVNEFSTDGTLAGDSDTAVPTEKAVKTYVDARTTVYGELWYDRATAGADLTVSATGTIIDPDFGGRNCVGITASTAAGTLTIATAGMYRVSLSVSLLKHTATGQTQITIQQNSTGLITSYEDFNTTGEYKTIHIEALANCAATDTLSVYFYGSNIDIIQLNLVANILA